MLVTVGAITRPHGIRGEVRVHLFNEGSDVLLGRDEVWLEREGEEPVRRAVRGARRHGAVVLLSFEGVADRDAAETLRGLGVAVPRDELPEPEEDEWYHVDLVGLRARTEDGEEAGEVVEVIAYPSADCLLLRHEGYEREVPLLEPYVLDVDLDAGRVTVAHLEDLDARRVRR